MNRKTNIFYNASSEDSKFITFNNYTEALTGDILAIDYKLWPSRFLCVYIDNLDKEEFIKQLQCYYENKLSTLRDSVDDISVLKPLNYLLTFLYWYAYNKDIDNEDNKVSPINIEIKMKKGNIDYNLVQFNYISDIVEQQYNGTYSDIICTINPSKWHKPVIQYITNDNESAYLNETGYVKDIDISSNFLHGWEHENADTIQKLNDYITNPIVDGTIPYGAEDLRNVYFIKSLIDHIAIVEEPYEKNLKFNLVIPLFNVINTANANDIENDEEDLTSIELNNKVNIPLGIYFTDGDVNLHINGKFSTNWSLLISTQFSAFPFSYDIQQNFDDSQSTKQAYLTFAEILANQTNFTDALTKYDNLIKSLQQRIILLESKLNSISTVQNIDAISKEVVIIQNAQDEFINEVNARLDAMDNKIEENKLKWQIKTKNNTI